MAISDGLREYLDHAMGGFINEDGGIEDDQWAEMRDRLNEIESEAWDVAMETEDIDDPRARLQWLKDNGLIKEVE